jgi:hypothetical protein
MRVAGLFFVGLMMAGCAPVTPPTANFAAYSNQLRSTETSQLCARYTQPVVSDQDRTMIEAELAARGVETCNGAAIGTTSASQVGTARFVRSGTDTGIGGQDYDCGDLGTGAQAQRFFLASGGPSSDPHNLDGDGDGFACEWGTEVRRIAARSVRAVAAPVRAPVVSTPRPSSGSGCFTGPRGGTYTITASGNRNYGGC